jgi:hypothetical protein
MLQHFAGFLPGQSAQNNYMKYSTATRKQIAEHQAKIAVQIQISQRAKDLGIEHNRSSLLMDLDSLPNLDLERLLAFPDFDFAHDVCGIMRHMDRSRWPGKLTDCFVPRAMRY